MGPVAAPLKFGIHAAENLVLGECPQKFMMAYARLVGSRKDGIDDAKPGRCPDPLRCDSGARSHYAAGAGCVLQSTNDSGANGDDAATATLCVEDGPNSGWRDEVRFVEGEKRVQCGVAGGGDARGVGNGGKTYSTPSQV